MSPYGCLDSSGNQIRWTTGKHTRACSQTQQDFTLRCRSTQAVPWNAAQIWIQMPNPGNTEGGIFDPTVTHVKKEYRPESDRPDRPELDQPDQTGVTSAEQRLPIMDHGSRIMDQRSKIKDHGSRIMDHGSWIKDHGSWIKDLGPWTLFWHE